MQEALKRKHAGAFITRKGLYINTMHTFIVTETFKNVYMGY